MVLDGNAVRSVDRAAALLLALGDSQGEAGVTELARRLGLHKSTASRLLATLQKRGLSSRTTRPASTASGWSSSASRTGGTDARPPRHRDAGAGAARPADPRDDRPRGARRRHAPDGRPGRRPEPDRGRRLDGRSTPLHCVASGKVLLAAVAEREVLRIVRRGLVSYTERTITELEPLLEELARIRRRGYATALGEFEMGLNAVAAPVHDARGNVIAAVDIWGPAFRLTPRRIPELAAQAREAAAAISVRLGGTGSATAAQPSLAQALANSSLAATEPTPLPASPSANGSADVAEVAAVS